MSDWEAEPAHWRLIDSAQLTVVVLDNCSLHTNKQVQAKWPQWQEKGLYFFFLPKYYSEMNLAWCVSSKAQIALIAQQYLTHLHIVLFIRTTYLFCFP